MVPRRRRVVSHRWSVSLRVSGVAALMAAILWGGAPLVGLGPRRPIGLVSRGGRSKPGLGRAKAAADAAPIPIFGDGWFDDSGIAIATDFEAPVVDAASLAQVGAAREGRGRRGIARIEQELA